MFRTAGLVRLFSFSIRESYKTKFTDSFRICIPFPGINYRKCHQTNYEKISHKINTHKDNSAIESIREDHDYKPSNDPNIFGGQFYLSDDLYDKEDIEEEEYNKEVPDRNKELIFYAKIIKKHLHKKQIKEALDVFEVRMKRDRVHADRYIFNLLISGCAKAGYARKAFKLFFKMKQYDIKPSGGTYTSLFNACANAPTITDGLSKAKRLREIIFESNYELNAKNYNAMIKAYGWCGDLSTAFQIADEIVEKNMGIETETFNFLLQACASDKEFGFRHSLLTWHKMKNKGVLPDRYSFNIILKCIKDCSIGDAESMNSMIKNIVGSKTAVDIGNDHTPQICSETNGNVLVLDDKNLKSENSEVNFNTTLSTSIELQTDVPNLLCSSPHLGNLIKISEINKPEDRLLLLGGFSGFLEEMKLNKITPGIETFTALLEVIPSTNSAEKKLISMIRKIGLKADIDFFNTLIKKRCLRFDYDGAKEVLNMIKTVKLRPDIFTFGILSLTCKTKEEARELILNMKQKDLRMNIQILGAMLNQGCYYKDFEYISEIMQISLDERIKPNVAFLKHLDRFKKQCSRMIEVKHPDSKSSNFINNYKKFKEALRIWYEENGIAGLKLEDRIEKIKENPYKKFKEPTKTENEKIDEKKIRKYIKKIKLHDLKEDNIITKS